MFVAEYFLPPWEVTNSIFSQHLVAISWAKSARLEMQLEGRWQSEVCPLNSISIVPMGQELNTRWLSPIHCLHICLTPQFLARVIYADTTDNAPTLRTCFNFQDPLVTQIAISLRTEQSAHEGGDRLYMETLAMTLAVHLLKHYGQSSSSLTDTSKFQPHGNLQSAVEFIMDNLEQSLSLDILAQLAQMSPSHFAHSFKKTIGVSPHRFIVQKRVEKAQYLLQKSQLTIGEIACQCGFASQSHLDNTFRKTVGTTPLKYRQQS